MNTQSSARVLTGLVVIIVGAAFLFDALGYASIGQLFRLWWPLLVIAIGVINLVGSPRQFVWPLFVVAAGVLLQLRALEIVQFEIWSLLWPLAIIATGLSFLIHPVFPDFTSTDDDRLNSLVVFSGNKLRSTSQHFRGGQLTAWFGGSEVDLRAANIQDRARLDVFAAFGGMTVQVPEHWVVKVNGLPLFGGWDNKTKATKTGPVLEVTGVCLFGGFEVKN